MEKIKLSNDIIVFGEQVQKVPQGIGEAFKSLQQMLPEGDERTFYGICDCSNGSFKYVAAAQEIFEGEADRYSLKKYRIEKGDYLAKTVTGWSENIDAIREAFASFGSNPDIDNSKPLIEVYKNMNEMMCMVKLKVYEKASTLTAQ